MDQGDILLDRIYQVYLSKLNELNFGISKETCLSFLSRLQKKGIRVFNDLSQKIPQYFNHIESLFIKDTLNIVNIYLDLGLGATFQEVFLLTFSGHKTIPRDVLKDLSLAGALYNLLIRLVDRMLDSKETTRRFLQIINVESLTLFMQYQGKSENIPRFPLDNTETQDSVKITCELIRWYLRLCYCYLGQSKLWRKFMNNLIQVFNAEVTCTNTNALTTPFEVLKKAYIMKSGLSPYFYIGLLSQYENEEILVGKPFHTHFLESIHHLNFFIRLADDLADLKSDWLAGKVSYLILNSIQQLKINPKVILNSEGATRKEYFQDFLHLFFEKDIHLQTLSCMDESFTRTFQIFNSYFSSSSTQRLYRIFQQFFFHPVLDKDKIMEKKET